jgi:RHS repeat-associated protein
MTGYDTGSNNLLLSDGTFDYVYDSEGNRTSRTRISNDPADDKTVLYEWDYRNRLTRVVFKDNSGDVTKEVIYEYDIFNRRITKIIDADGEGVGVAEQTDFIYDGQDIVLALDGEGSLTNRYLHGPAIDQILADEQIAEEQLIWTLADNLGSVRDLVNNAGEVESHIDYTAFGAVETITNNLVQTLYGFTGRERDAETGQTYHRARYYDPLVGRWLSEDPIGFYAGDGNLGRYVGNNPVNYTDPSGLVWAEVKQFGSDYWYYLTNPWEMDDDLEAGFYIAGGIGVGAGLAAGGIVAISYLTLAGIKGAAWWAATEVFDTSVEWAISKVVGFDVMIPMSPSDLLQDGFKFIFKKGAKEALEHRLSNEALEEMRERCIKAGTGCFVAGTEVAMAEIPAESLLAEDATATGTTAMARLGDGAATVVIIAGVVGFATSKRRRKRSADALTLDGAVGSGSLDELDTDAPWSGHDSDEPKNKADGTDTPTLTLPTKAEAACPEGVKRAERPASARASFGWLAACLLFAVTWFGRGQWSSAPEQPCAPPVAAIATRPANKPIEQVQVGDRVHVDSAEAEHDLSLGDDVDPATWRRIELRAPKQDGSWANVTLLRPLAWIAERNACVGERVSLDIAEIGIIGEADVLSITACPAIADGPGRIVTGTFRHESAATFDLHVEGLPEPIGTTGNHPFWSMDRQEFVRADSLEPGERLQGLDGPLAVNSLTRRADPEPVYNLEIQVAHVYHVGSAGVLVHNAYDFARISNKVRWLDHTPSMDSAARHYEDAAAGARSRVSTQRREVPVVDRTLPTGSKAPVKFDGIDEDVLIDRKTAITTFQKSKNQALRQSQALTENGLQGRWEVPNEAAAKRARKMLQQLGITCIDVRVVP